MLTKKINFQSASHLRLLLESSIEEACVYCLSTYIHIVAPKHTSRHVGIANCISLKNICVTKSTYVYGIMFLGVIFCNRCLNKYVSRTTLTSGYCFHQLLLRKEKVSKKTSRSRPDFKVLIEEGLIHS